MNPANDTTDKPVMIPISTIRSRLEKRIELFIEARKKLSFWQVQRYVIITGAIAALRVELEDITALEATARIAGEDSIP